MISLHRDDQFLILIYLISFRLSPPSSLTTTKRKKIGNLDSNFERIYGLHPLCHNYLASQRGSLAPVATQPPPPSSVTDFFFIFFSISNDERPLVLPPLLPGRARSSGHPCTHTHTHRATNDFKTISSPSFLSNLCLFTSPAETLKKKENKKGWPAGRA